MNSNSKPAAPVPAQALSGALARLEQDIADGKLKAANKRHATIARQLEDHGAASRQQKVDFRALAHKLQELNDWQGFATRPKRVELCEQMETLASEPAIPPPEKAKAIKELQQAWRALGPAGARDAQRLWGRFKAAGDTAYAPCAAYFARQRDVRMQNVAEREHICEYLEAFERDNDWDNPNWRAVATIINKAGVEWQKYADIPRSHHKKLQKRFDRIEGCLQAHLKDEQNRNHEKKSSLIEQARACNETEDLPVAKAIDTIKRLQQQWRSIGVTDRRRDQKLWKAFRTQCDRAFARRDEDKALQKAKVQQNNELVRELCRGFNQSLANGEVDVDALKQFQGAFERAQTDIKDHQSWKDYKHLAKQARIAIEKRAKASHRDMLSEIKRKAALCARLEHGQIDQTQADAAWDSDVELTPSLSQRIESRKSAIGDTDPGAVAANQDAANRLCVQLEMLAGIESPPEAARIRTQCQVDRLKRELSQGQKETRSTAERAEGLIVDFYCLGKLPADIGDLTDRLERAEEKLLGKLQGTSE